MAVDDATGTTDPSYTNAAGVNAPVQMITHVDANGVSTIRYQRTVVPPVTYTTGSYINVGGAYNGTEGSGVFQSFTAWSALTTPTTQAFLNEERFRILLFTTTGRLQDQVTTCDGSDGSVGTAAQCGLASFTRTVSASNSSRTTSNTGRQFRNNVTPNPDFVAIVGPTALITGDTSALRPSTIQLTNASTAGDNPITSVVWSDDSAFIDVDQSGEVTSFGVFSATITLTVTDSVGLQSTDTHTVSFSNPVAPTISVIPTSVTVSGVAGAGATFIISTPNGGTVTVSGTASWLDVNPDGTWSTNEDNPGAARSDVFRFTVRDNLNQSDFADITVTQQAVQVCREVTITGGSFFVYSRILCGSFTAQNASGSGTITECVILDSVSITTGTATITYGTVEC